jgi:hypothetical protein
MIEGSVEKNDGLNPLDALKEYEAKEGYVWLKEHLEQNPETQKDFLKAFEKNKKKINFYIKRE